MLITFLFASCFSVDICAAIQRGYNQDGCEQPGHGDGSQLPPMPVGWSTDHLWEHAQRDVLPEDADRSPGHQLHWGGGVDAANHRVHLSYTIKTIHKHCLPLKHTGNSGDERRCSPSKVSLCSDTKITAKWFPLKTAACETRLTFSFLTQWMSLTVFTSVQKYPLAQ